MKIHIKKKKKKKKKLNHRSAREIGEKRLGSEMLRPAEAWVGVVEREKKEEGVGRRAERIGDEGAWGGSASWSTEQIGDEGWPAS